MPTNTHARAAGASIDHLTDRPLTLREVLADLLADGWVTRAQCEELLFREQQSGDARVHPLVLIAEQGWSNAATPRIALDIERLTRWLADRAGLEYLRIDPLKIDLARVTAVFKHAYATRFNILPVAVHGHRVTVATAEPYVREWERELGKLLKLEFRRVLANPLAVRRYLDEFYALSRSLAGAVSSHGTSPLDSIGNFEQLVELGRSGELDANDQHVVQIVDWLLQYAFDQRASDIHLEPRREQANVRFRIDGVLHLVNQIPTTVMTAVVSRLKALGRLDVIERRRPQDGRIKTKTPQGREIELRLSTMPTTFGEKLVMRIFDPDVLVKSLRELGFTRHDEARWAAMTAHPYGMIIVTGPTGSGKTTTLYSALKRLARPELNVCTIEDPIELVDPQLNQMNVQPQIGVDFASGVRTLLRQDPDIIMVGEIRDAETAETAIQAALTGHLVLTTLHTNDAPTSVSRLLDLGVAPFLIKSALLGVVAQRLVRTLCPHCKQPAQVPADEWKSLVHPLRLRRPPDTCGPVGCEECRHTGFRGRIGIYEIMTASDSLRAAITPGLDLRALRRLAIGEDMRTLRISGAQKVQAGLTTPGEVFGAVGVDEAP